MLEGRNTNIRFTIYISLFCWEPASIVSVKEDFKWHVPWFQIFIHSKEVMIEPFPEDTFNSDIIIVFQYMGKQSIFLVLRVHKLRARSSSMGYSIRFPQDIFTLNGQPLLCFSDAKSSNFIFEEECSFRHACPDECSHWHYRPAVTCILHCLWCSVVEGILDLPCNLQMTTQDLNIM